MTLRASCHNDCYWLYLGKRLKFFISFKLADVLKYVSCKLKKSKKVSYLILVKKVCFSNTALDLLQDTQDKDELYLLVVENWS